MLGTSDHNAALLCIMSSICYMKASVRKFNFETFKRNELTFNIQHCLSGGLKNKKGDVRYELTAEVQAQSRLNLDVHQFSVVTQKILERERER